MWEKSLDAQNRITIPTDLIEHAGFFTRNLALCWRAENIYVLKEEHKIQGEKVMTFLTLDSKNRIFIPKELRKNFSTYRVYLKDYTLTIEGTV